MLIKVKKIPIKEILLIGILPSFLKKIIYRSKGHDIGKNVSFSIGSVIIGKKVRIGDNASFGVVSVVRGTSIDIGRFVKIGSFTIIDTEKIIIGEDSRINEMVIVGGIKTPESLFKIGKRVIIMEYSYINPTKPIEIGDDSGIGGHCLLFTHGSWLSQLDGFPVTFAPIKLGKKVWLPWRVFIMPGVEIGNEVVIGANSLVSKNLPSNVLAAGTPAKVLVEDYPKAITEEKRQEIFDTILNDFIAYLNHHEFIVNISEEEDNKIIKISKGSKISQIFITKKNSAPNFSTNDNLMIINSNSNNTNESKMMINLTDKTRKGTSNVGEEFIKFLSRYGVRFDRLD